MEAIKKILHELVLSVLGRWGCYAGLGPCLRITSSALTPTNARLPKHKQQVREEGVPAAPQGPSSALSACFLSLASMCVERTKAVRGATAPSPGARMAAWRGGGTPPPRVHVRLAARGIKG